MGVGVRPPVSSSAAPRSKVGVRASKREQPHLIQNPEEKREEKHKVGRPQRLQEPRNPSPTPRREAGGGHVSSQRARPSVFLRPRRAVYKVQEGTRTLPLGTPGANASQQAHGEEITRAKASTLACRKMRTAKTMETFHKATLAALKAQPFTSEQFLVVG